MKNPLTEHFDNWVKIGSSSQILEWVNEGVIFPFSQDIQGFEYNNKHFSQNETAFLHKEVSDLLLLGYIETCDYVPLCVSPIGCVKKKNGSFRLITDLRTLNNKCIAPKFKYEDIETVKNCVKPGDYMITADLKNGFFHVPVNINQRDYLGFKFNNQYYRWTVLPFGHCCSPYFFNKVLRPVITYLRSIGIRTVLYVDDFIVFAPLNLVYEHRNLFIDLLQSLGLTINFEKSDLVPSLSKTFIGYVIDNTCSRTIIKVTPNRIRKVKKDIGRVLKHQSVTARGLARIAGQCVSMSKCILPAKLLLRNVYRLLKTRLTWRDVLKLDSCTKNDLKWWFESLSQWNGVIVECKPIDCQLVTDASSIAWGAWTGSQKAQGFWNNRVAYSSSNYRELLAVYMGLMSFRRILRNKHVQILSDNITVVAFVNKFGGASTELDCLARDIHLMAIENKITLQAAYLSGVENWKADQLSRMSSTYEWMLHPNLFQLLDRVWGPHQVDRFASFMTTHLPEYNSMFWDPLTHGVDALAQTDWASKNNYVNPPFALIPKVLDIIQSQGAIATLIAPKWEGQFWYQRLQSMLIDQPIRLPTSPRTILAIGPKAEPLKNVRWKLYAWRICGRLDSDA